MEKTRTINYRHEEDDDISKAELDEGWTPLSNKIQLPESDVRNQPYPDSNLEVPRDSHSVVSRCSTKKKFEEGAVLVSKKQKISELSYPTPPPTNRLDQKALIYGGAIPQANIKNPMITCEVMEPIPFDPSFFLMNTSGQVSAIPLEEISSSLELTSPRILSERKLLVEPYLSPLNHISMRPLSLEYTPSSRIRVPPRVIRAPASCLSPLQQLAGCAVMEARLNTSINPHQMAGPSGPWNKKRSSTSNFWKAKGTAKEAKKSAVRGLKAVSGSNSRAKTNNIQVEESIARGVKRKSISNSPKDTAGPKTKKPKTSSSAKVEGGVISSHSTGKGGRTSARAKHSANSEKHMASSKATGDSSIKPQNSLSSSPSEDKEGNASRVVEGKIGANSSGDGAIPDSDTLESKTRTGRIYSFSGPSKGEDLVTDVNTEAGLAPKIEIATKSTTVDPADDTIAGRLATRKRKNKM